MTNVPPPSPPPGPKALWAKFRSWPKAGQVAVWVLVSFIALGAIGSATEKKPAAVPALTTDTTATSATTAPPTSTAPPSTAPSTSSAPPTTAKATTTTAANLATTTTARAATTTTTRPTTTTTKAPATTTTTRASTTTSTAAGYVHAGAFCSPAGAEGYTSTGTHMVCKTTPTDDRNRWRAG